MMKKLPILLLFCYLTGIVSIRMMKYLPILLLFCYSTGIGAIDFCEDRSTAIERGQIQCSIITRYYNRPRYTCQLSCHPGYVAYPSRQITCTSNGNRVWRIDSNGNRAQVYTGTWSSNIELAECRAPTSCPSATFPTHGSATCTTENNTITCLRTCEYPYEVTDKEFQKEHCGPHTKFFWSHFLRHNSTTMPPCAPPVKCRPLQDTDMPEHGQMRCRVEDWADTIICELDCERGYIPKKTSKHYVFCGPTTAFIWSHVHVARRSYARIGGCEQSPVTAEVTVTLDKPCDNISAFEKQQGAEELKEVIKSEMMNLNNGSNISLIGWKVYCNSTIIQKTVTLAGNQRKDDTSDYESTTTTDVTTTSTESKSSSEDSEEVKLESAPSEEINQRGNDFVLNLIEPDSQSPNENDTSSHHPVAENKPDDDDSDETFVVNATISELTYSVYYNVSCIRGKCWEACKALGLLKEDLQCPELCAYMARSSFKQVRHLPTSYAGHLMKGIDVSTANDIIKGAKFKSFNVTSAPSSSYTLSDNDIQYIKRNHYSRYSSRNDQC